MAIEIKHKHTGAVLLTVEADTLSGANLRGADLSGANLRDANLSGADLSVADLSVANLRSANLSGADLRSANLRGADLSGADLRSANLSYANLRSANLSGANLGGANLRSANLSGANLGGANLSGADLSGADLSAKNLTGEVFGITVDESLPKRVAKAVLASDDALEMNSWHTCETTHCIAGWAIHLSGPAGYALEAATSPSVAGAMLMPSAAHLFMASNDEARAWLREQLAK